MGSVRVYTNKNFNEAFTYPHYSLCLFIDNYSSFYIKSIILNYNICYEDSILKKINISDENFNLINKSNNNKNELLNKTKLKINEKNLPLTTDLSEWGDLSIIKGDYPYQFNLKETKVLINTESNTFLVFEASKIESKKYQSSDSFNSQSSDSFNDIVSIRGLHLNGKKIILHKRRWIFIIIIIINYIYWF